MCVNLAGDADNGNGFVFDGIDEASMDSALDRALQYHRCTLLANVLPSLQWQPSTQDGHLVKLLHMVCYWMRGNLLGQLQHHESNKSLLR